MEGEGRGKEVNQEDFLVIQGRVIDFFWLVVGKFEKEGDRNKRDYGRKICSNWN